MPTFPGSTVTTQARQQGIDVPREDEVLGRSQASAVVARVPSPRDFVGPALRRASQTVARVGAQLEVQENRNDAFAAQAGYIDFINRQDENFVERTRTASGEEALNIQTDIENDFDTDAKAFFSTVPDSQKAAVDLKLRQARGRFRTDASGTQFKKAREFYGGQIASTGNKALVAIRDDPALLEGRLRDQQELIAAIPDDVMSAREKTVEFRKFRLEAVRQTALGLEAQGKSTEAKQLLDDFRAGTRKKGTNVDTAGGVVVDRIVQVESGGRATAKNPRSSATGLGQFIGSTWMAMMKRHHPELVRGRSKAQILELRKNPALSREMTARYADQNSKILQDNGFKATHANVYLAHFLGPGGALKVLRADPDASIATVLPAGVLKANPFLRGKTANDVMAWTAQKMGKGSTTQEVEVGPQYFDKLSGELATLRKNRETAASTQIHDAARLDIRLNPNTWDENRILETPGLTNSRKDQLIGFMREQQKKDGFGRRARQVLGDGSGPDDFNEFNKDDRKLANELSQNGQLVPDLPVDSAARELGIVKKMGFVSDPAQRKVRSGLNSENFDEFFEALRFGDAALDVSTRAFDGRDGAASIRDRVQDYKGFLGRNYSPEDAARAVLNARDAERTGNKQQITQVGKEQIKEMELTPEKVVSRISDAWLSDPEVNDIDPALRIEMVDDFESIYLENLRATGGNEELAMMRTERKMKELYSPSEMAEPGDKGFSFKGPALVKNAFEKIYPQAAVSGDFEPFRKAAAKEASKALGRDIAPEDFLLIPDNDNLDSQGRPRYRLFYLTEGPDGEKYPQWGGLYFDPADTIQSVRVQHSANTRETAKRRDLVKRAPDDVTVAEDENGEEVFVDLNTREILVEGGGPAGTMIGTGRTYVPPREVDVITGTEPTFRESAKPPVQIDPEKDFVQRGPNNTVRVIQKQHYTDLDEERRGRAERIKREKWLHRVQPFEFGSGTPVPAPTRKSRPSLVFEPISEEEAEEIKAQRRDGKFEGLVVDPSLGGKPQIKNQDGSISTERTTTVKVRGAWFNIPTIVNGEQISEKRAAELFRQGQHAAVGGPFDTVKQAEKSARERTKKLDRLLRSE